MNLLLVIVLGFATIFVAIVYYCVLFGYYSYLFDLLFKTASTIILLGLSAKGLLIFINWCFSNNYEPDYDTGKDLFAGATYKIEAEKESFTPTLLQEKPSQSANVGYDFTIKEIKSGREGVEKSYPQGSQGAMEAWKTSDEKKALERRKAELNREIAKIAANKAYPEMEKE
jgi:hypothetical protein